MILNTRCSFLPGSLGADRICDRARFTAYTSVSNLCSYRALWMKKPIRVFLIILLSAVAALLGLLIIRNLIDYPVYYAAGQSLLGGRSDLYAPDFALGQVMDYRYPPLFLVSFAPLWNLPYSISAYVWYLMSLVEIFGCAVIVLRIFPEIGRSTKLWLLVVLGTVQYFVMVLHYGNAHLLATFCLFAALYFLIAERSVLAGLLMAIAITIKLTPLLVLPYLAIKRRWNILAMVFVFLVVLNLIPAFWFGFEANNRLLAGWYRHVVASQEFHEDNGPINLSLKGQLRRYLSTIPYSERVDGDVRYPEVNVASLSRQQLFYAWLIVSSVITAGVLALLWRNRKGPRTEEGSKANQRIGLLETDLSIMICLMLLVEPLTSKIYFIALLWPLACLASIAVEQLNSRRAIAPKALIAIAAINLILPLLPGRSIQRWLLALGADFYLNCLLMGVLLFVLLHRRVTQLQSGVSQMPAQSEAKMP